MIINDRMLSKHEATRIWTLAVQRAGKVDVTATHLVQATEAYFRVIQGMTERPLVLPNVEGKPGSQRALLVHPDGSLELTTLKL